MCGICGIVRRDQAVSRKQIQSMCEMLHHRGPDDCGMYCADNIGLGHKRLSIIDVSKRGHQPMGDDNNSVYITYNGEIYNFIDIRSALRRKGHEFTSNTDTEVILRAFIEYGEECVRMFDGIFSFAIYSSKTRKLFLARDHFGVKPMYMYVDKEYIVFSSEVKALKAVLNKPLELNANAVAEYFLYRSISGVNTMYHQVIELSPGAYLSIDCTDLTMHKVPYFSLKASEQCAVASEYHVEALLKKSVNMQMVSDVPVGTMCSGGIDSSLVTFFASTISNKPLHTFSVGFPRQASDESQYASFVADQCETKHTSIKATPDDIVEYLENLTYHNDVPISHYNSVFMYLIANTARSMGVKVLLSGEGADELFAGYKRIVNVSTVSKYCKYNIIPVSLIRFITSNIMKRGILDMAENYKLYDSNHFIALLLTINNISTAKHIFGENVVDGIISKRAAAISLYDEDDIVEKTRRYEIDNYLPSILLRQDKMCMAASIEARVPFLSNGLTQYAMRHPARSFINGRTAKWPLKEMAFKYFGGYIADRPKVGFHVPYSSWLRESSKLYEFTASWLLNKQALYTQYIPNSYIEKQFQNHIKGIDSAELLWTVLCLEIWLNLHK